MKKQSGFAVLEAMVIAVILAVIGGAGYMVWQRQQVGTSKTSDKTAIAQVTKGSDVDKATLSKDCAVGEMKGMLYTAPKAVFSICIPSGWHLWSFSKGTALIGEGTDLTYVKDVAPQVTVSDEGKDGAFEFSVMEGAASGAPPDFNMVGQFKAGNVTGTEYARTETKTAEGLGGVPKGTIQHAYYFEHAGRGVEIDYNLMPGKADHTDDAAAVAKTLIFN